MKPIKFKDCPDCGGMMIIDSHLGKVFYKCLHHDSCTGKALANRTTIPVNKLGRRYRRDIHEVGKMLWGNQHGQMLHRWLKSRMPTSQGHVGQLTREADLRIAFDELRMMATNFRGRCQP